MAIRSAKGTVIKLGDGASPEAFATIAQLRSISGTTTKANVQDVTTHDQAGNFMDKLAVLIDPGTFSAPMNYDKAEVTHAFATGLWNLLINLTLRTYRIVFPASIGYLQMDAYVTGHGFTAPVDNVLQVNAEWTITGSISTANTAEP